MPVKDHLEFCLQLILGKSGDQEKKNGQSLGTAYEVACHYYYYNNTLLIFSGGSDTLRHREVFYKHGESFNLKNLVKNLHPQI